MKEIRACSTSGILGYGFPEASLQRCMNMNPDFIACDAGSTDPGPYHLGSGKPFVSRDAVKRDLRLILVNAQKAKIPVLIGSAGGAGSKQGVEGLVEILHEISAEQDLSFKLAVIQAEVTKQSLRQKLQAQKIAPLGNAAQLTEDHIQQLDRAVGMMGPEPFMKALENGAEVVIAGRASDAALFASYPIFKGMNPDYAWHAAKIIECGAATAVPKSHDCIMAYIRDDEFIIETPNPDKELPWKNVAAHTMYENVSPFHLKEPGGMLDTSKATYHQIDERSVSVTGSAFVQDHPYRVKLEGVEKTGYRTISILGIRDPILLSQLDEYLAFVRETLKDKIENVYGESLTSEDYSLVFRRYGLDGVMGEMEQEKEVPHEIGLLIDVVANDQPTSEAIAALVRTLVLHSHFEGRLSISGNAAFPFSPTDIPVGEVYRFTLNHVVALEDECELFPIEYKEV